MPATDDEIREKYLERAIRELNALTREIQGCAHCPRGNLMPVLGSGHPQADIFLLKYAPTKAEIEEGVAFYGRTGSALMKSFKRLGIDPLTVYGTLCVKCPVGDGSLADPGCVARVVEELAIVQPRIVVVMGEDALTVLNEKLQQEIAERREIQAALQVAKSEAEQANLGKTKFLAAASHDLLQPLNAARLFVSALSALDQDERNSAMIDNVDESLGAVEDLLGTLLDISKLDAGAVSPEIVDFQVNSLLVPLTTEYTVLANERGLQLRALPSSCVVRSDPRLLRRIVQNFLANAIRYTPKGRVLLYTLAAWIAASRVLIGEHYFTDVIAGAILGTAFPYLVRERFAARRWLFERTPEGGYRLRGVRTQRWLGWPHPHRLGLDDARLAPPGESRKLDGN